MIFEQNGEGSRFVFLLLRDGTECTRLKLRSYSLVEVRNRSLLYAVSAYVMGKDESVACLEACSSVALGESCF